MSYAEINVHNKFLESVIASIFSLPTKFSPVTEHFVTRKQLVDFLMYICPRFTETYVVRSFIHCFAKNGIISLHTLFLIEIFRGLRKVDNATWNFIPSKI